VEDTAVLVDFVSWTAQVLAARQVPVRAFAVGVEIFAEQLGDFPRARAMLDAGLAELRPLLG
jgi:hypothetical protein